MIKHRADAPVVACALALALPIVTRDRHFQTRKVKEKIRVYSPENLTQELERQPSPG